jgi:hypothetical protein
MPTTVQVFPHGLGAYARNALRRWAPANLLRYLLHRRGTGWTGLAGSLLGRAVRKGGVFHLWGHSWEIEATGQWKALGEVLAILGAGGRIASATNGEICRSVTPA